MQYSYQLNKTQRDVYWCDLNSNSQKKLFNFLTMLKKKNEMNKSESRLEEKLYYCQPLENMKIKPEATFTFSISNIFVGISYEKLISNFYFYV